MSTPDNDEKATYLFAWNPKNFAWDRLDDQIRRLQTTGTANDRWSCGQVKSIPPGSRFFLIRLGNEPRGIVGAGFTVSDVQETPHWDAALAAKGETSNMVDLRFDALSRTPLLPRRDLDEPPFDGFKWDTQMSGIRIPEERASALETEWRKRLEARERGETPSVLADHVIERWRESWSEASADTSWLERGRLLDTKREEVLPQIRELVVGFIDGDVSLQEFRDTFDVKTRNEWDLFGFKGLSGAAFLNKLVKHLPDQAETTERLRRTLREPTNEAEAREKLHGFMTYLEAQIEAGVATGGALQPNRAPFFVSSCWHVQNPEAWPIFYQSARKALRSDGLLGSMRGADGYLEFARVFRALTEALALHPWSLEHLCVRKETPTDEGDGTDGPDDEEEASQKQSVWLIAPGKGAKLFDQFYEEGIIAIGWSYLGDLSQYDSVDAVKEAIQKEKGGGTNPFHTALACYQFAHEMRVGDVVFAKKGTKKIVGYGIITSAYRYEPERDNMPQVRSVDWKKRGEWVARDKPLVTKTLTQIGNSPRLLADIRRALDLDAGTEDDPPEGPGTESAPAFTLDDALTDLFLPREDVEEALELLRYKKNLVLQGPPGVGKTFFAKRLAYLLLGQRDPDRVEQVQFHQSYSYEDFIQGYRPSDDGKFARADGPFMRFCDQALQDVESPYVLIIDEINRGDLSKIFGELLLLIESDKRSERWATTLTYSSEGEARFYVPKNVHIIGTMNTADRSLAMVDYALRRRFVFLDVPAGFGQGSFVRRLRSLGAEPALSDRVVRRLTRLNEQIAADGNLGSGFCIGHSYFCQTGGDPADESWFKRIVRTEIAPLLREYWFDNTDRADDAVAQLLDDD